MNVSNLILSMQEKMQSSDDALDLMIYSKVIEKLKIGNIDVVASFNDLPTLETDGNLFLVENERLVFYNVGNNFISLGNIIEDLAYGWGTGGNGRLGNFSSANQSSPVTVAGGIVNWSRVSAGGFHSLGITDDGKLFSWGNGQFGQTGLNNTSFSNFSPTVVVGGITNWSYVDAGNNHSLGVTDTGIAYAWGGNGGGLGDGTTIPRSSPVTVVGGITNWSQLSGGNYFSLGLTDTGIAYAWGSNSTTGKLGDGTTINRSSPVTVVGGITNWSQVSANNNHSLGLTSTGIAYAWGQNNFGQLGDGTIINRSSPVTVVGGITTWSQLSAGGDFGLGVTTTGVLYAWGNNGGGAVGDGTTINKSSPVTVIGGITNWNQVDAGRLQSLAITNSGVAYAWGFDFNGSLGTGDRITRSSPVTVVGGITTWSQLSGGNYHSLAINSGVKTFIKT